ncbi:hypothetical protein [Shewanella sp. Isolate11]|uniref:hypothetical protein n=1 Tax=Shewanella sp. Isolate11 TaxID=2908530 RepID=UPI001EFDA3B0|nr:hypothetical protein [Shewanella sp. Isolate11]MCG9696127.1 hypothetical protein [Shewanella sp. Isolate11]
MTPVDQVLAAAKQLLSSGKTPSIALLKSKLGNSVPMPVIIQGLQRFKSLSKSEIAALQSSTDAVQTAQPEPQTISLISLNQEIQSLREQQQKLLDRVAQLESALQQKENS